MKLTGYTCAYNSLTNFQYEADAITGNGRIVATIVAPSQVVKLTGYTYACNSLTNFQYEADAITGNGRAYWQ